MYNAIACLTAPRRLGEPCQSQSAKLALQSKLGLWTLTFIEPSKIKTEDDTRMLQQTQPFLSLGSSRVPGVGLGLEVSWQLSSALLQLVLLRSARAACG